MDSATPFSCFFTAESIDSWRVEDNFKDSSELLAPLLECFGKILEEKV